MLNGKVKRKEEGIDYSMEWWYQVQRRTTRVVRMILRMMRMSMCLSKEKM